jgi:hypothetical protein
VICRSPMMDAQYLDSACPSAGLTFGRDDYRPQLSKAAEKALPPTWQGLLRRTTSVTAARPSWPPRAISRAPPMMGHKQLTTLNRYARPEQAAAARVLEARSRAIGVVGWAAPETAAPRRLLGQMISQ